MGAGLEGLRGPEARAVRGMGLRLQRGSGTGTVRAEAPASTRRQPQVPSGLRFIGAFRLRPHQHHRSATPTALTLRPTQGFPGPRSAGSAARTPTGQAGPPTFPEREDSDRLLKALPPAPFHIL